MGGSDNTNIYYELSEVNSQIAKEEAKKSRLEEARRKVNNAQIDIEDTSKIVKKWGESLNKVLGSFDWEGTKVKETQEVFTDVKTTHKTYQNAHSQRLKDIDNEIRSTNTKIEDLRRKAKNLEKQLAQA